MTVFRVPLAVLLVTTLAPSSSFGAKCSDTSGFAAARALVDAAAPCGGKRGKYVKTARKAVKGAGLSKPCQKLFLKLHVVQSTCGRSGEICCQARKGASGRFVRKAKQCKPPGVICTGGASVVAACESTGACAAPPTTTTTLPTAVTTTTTTLPQTADPTQLAVVGVVGPDPAPPGGRVTYQVVVTNTGAAPALGVKVRMPIPDGSYGIGCLMDGATLVQGGSCDAGAVYEWAVGALAPGASATVQPSVQLTPSSLPPAIATSIRASADNAPQAGPIDVAAASDAAAPLQLAIHDGPDPAAPGQAITFVLTFGNRGDVPRLNATLTATLPPGLVLDPTSLGDGGAAGSGTLTWPLGTLSPGAAGQRTFRATVTDLGAGDPRTRRVTAQLVDGGVPQASARAASVTVVEPAAVLGLALIATPDPQVRGGGVTYRLTVTNLTDAPVTGVTARLQVPVGSYGIGCLMDGSVLAEGGSCDAGAVYAWTLGVLPARGSVTVEPLIDTTPNLPAGFLLTTLARARDDAGRGASAGITTVVDPVAPLQLAVHDGPDPAAPGAVVAYTLTFGNRGSEPRLNAALAATLPPGLTLDPGSLGDGGTETDGIVTWPLGTLSPGAVGQRTFNATVTDLGAGDPRTRRVTAQLVDGGVPQASARAASVTVVEPAAVLGLALIATPDPQVRGGGVTYRLTVTNLTDAPLTGVTARLRVPFGSYGIGCLMDGSVLAEGGSCDAGAVYAWTLGVLPARGSVTVEPLIDTTPNLPAGFLLTTLARARDDAGRGASAGITTVVDPVAPLQLAVHDGPDPAAPRAVVAYTLTFGNRGSEPRLNAALAATLPPGLTLDPGSLGDGGTETDGIVTWPLGTLSPGAVGQRTFNATVTDLGAGDPRTRRVTAQLVDGGVPQASARAASVTVVEPAAVLGLALIATPDPQVRGGGVTYRLTVTNLTDAPLTGVTARLRVPFGSYGIGCLMDGSVLAEGGSCDAGAVYAWTLGVLPARGSVTVEPLIDTTPNLPAGFLLTTLARARDDAGRAATTGVTSIVTIP